MFDGNFVEVCIRLCGVNHEAVGDLRLESARGHPSRQITMGASPGRLMVAETFVTCYEKKVGATI
jgi:hypothetical protein